MEDILEGEGNIPEVVGDRIHHRPVEEVAEDNMILLGKADSIPFDPSRSIESNNDLRNEVSGYKRA